ncbi:hypothetical protein G3I34_20550, partial [Streptomyces sp. SID8014]|nr:hypothetical protein [Streptomyces sp. SID8014]
MAGREAGNTADDTSGAGGAPSAPAHRTGEAPLPVPGQPGAPGEKPVPEKTGPAAEDGAAEDGQADA